MFAVKYCIVQNSCLIKNLCFILVSCSCIFFEIIVNLYTDLYYSKSKFSNSPNFLVLKLTILIRHSLLLKHLSVT